MLLSSESLSAAGARAPPWRWHRWRLRFYMPASVRACAIHSRIQHHNTIIAITSQIGSLALAKIRIVSLRLCADHKLSHTLGATFCRRHFNIRSPWKRRTGIARGEGLQGLAMPLLSQEEQWALWLSTIAGLSTSLGAAVAVSPNSVLLPVAPPSRQRFPSRAISNSQQSFDCCG